jgi:hypothetical protein
MVGSDCNKIFKRAYISGSHYPSVWYPSAKQKSPFLHFFFSIKVYYGEISSGIRATVAAKRRKRRSKFPNPDRSQKFVIFSVTKNVWPPCPARHALPCPCPARQIDTQTPCLL